jgi:hypothetical protein
VQRLRPLRRILVLLAPALAGLGLSLPARAQCTYNTLTNDIPVTSASATTLYSFSGSSGFWGAVGTRSASGSNHDLAVFSSTAASPTCVTNQVGASATASGVDFVLGDFRPGRNGLGTFYSKLTRTTGSGSALMELDSGGDEIVVDDDPIVRNTDQVLDVFQVFLEAGVSYIVDFRPSLGVDAKVLIFRNPAAAPYWAGRASRLVESTGLTNFTAPGSDEYAVVVVNDDGGFSTYSLAIDQCQPPIDLTGGVPVSTSPPLRYVQAQTQPYWSAVGVRGAGSDDWNLTAYTTGRGALEPVCFQDSVATSSRVGGGVDFAVGDFTYNPLTPYYARVHQMSGSQVGIVEWDDGPDEFTIGADPIQRSTGPGDVLEVWDVYLTYGLTYTIFFERAGAADTRFFVFENGLQSSTVPYWADRSGAVLTGTGHTGYSPAVSGYHGIVVVNDNGGAGTYKVGVYGTAVGVAPSPALPNRPTLDALTPNPAFGQTTIAFSLPRAGRVGFDVLDVSGRLVARIPARDAAAGPGREVWDARSGGTHVRPGVYFIRMDYGGSPVGLSKLILLP